MSSKSKLDDLDKGLLDKAHDEGLRSVLKLLPFAQLTAVICSIFILLMFNHVVQTRVINLIIVLAITATAFIWCKIAYIDINKSELLGKNILLKHMAFAGLSAGLFSIQCVCLFNYAIGMEAVFLGAYIVAMITYGSFMLFTSQYIALIWIAFFGASPIIIMLRNGSYKSIVIIIPIFIFYAYVIKNVNYTSRLFIELKLKEEQLKNALKLAEDATEVKSGFLANMSHEIRTPMNAIIGMSYLALRTQLNEKQKDYLSKINNAANSLLGIINNILDFSKLESGKLEIENIDFVLDDVITNAIALISQAADEKQLEILYHVPFDIPQKLIGDPLRLKQVITNIFSNAVKFTKKGEIGIDIECISHIGNKIKLQFKIQDTGIGMSREAIGKLFKSFTQADNSTTRKFGGTGLGFAISSNLVQMMGGTLWAESEVSVGSTFTFTAWFENIYNNRLKICDIPKSIEHMKVLIVDDSKAAREICMEYLKEMSFIVNSASSGEEAILVIKQADTSKPYDVVFVDWKMDGMNGIDVAIKIQQGSYLSHKPAVVLVTAFDKEELIRRARYVKIDDFLVKPISQSMIYESIVKIFFHDKVMGRVNEVIVENNYKLSGISVLLVEDNEINQQIAIELLESQGITVDIATNGVEAVHKIANMPFEMPYNIVLMDLQMPEMDGFEATRVIRKKEKKLPIIAMTARAMLEERQKCFDVGMNDHVSKPIDPDILFTTISRWIPDILKRTNVTKIDTITGSVIQIEGIDVETGLKRVAHNKKLYCNLLLKYSTNQTKTVINLWKAIKQNDFISAEVLAHTLNGVSGNIGATKVQFIAKELENIFKSGANVEKITPIMNELEVLVNKISKDINDKITDTSEGKKNGEAINGIKLRQYMSNLLEMLRDNDSEAVDYFDTVKNEISGSIDFDELSKITRMIKMFEYDEVIIVIENILKDIYK